MAKFYNVNNAFSTGAAGMFEFKNVLTGSGWTVISSSAAYSAGVWGAGDYITGSADLAVANAWFVVQEPTGTGGREWCFQRTTNNTMWRIKISPNAGFSGGSAGQTRVPSATDEGVLLGTGTDASPTGVAFFGTDNTYKFHIIAESTPVGPAGNQVYGFWAFANITGGSADADMRSLLCQEPLASGSYPPLVGTRQATTSGEADPAVYGVAKNDINGYSFTGSAGYVFGNSSDINNTFRGFHNYNNSSGSLAYMDEVIGGATRCSVSTHPNTGQDIVFPYFCGRTSSGAFTRATYVGFKGVFNNIKRKGTVRGNGDTVNLATDAYILVGDILLPWPEGVAPVL